MSQITVTLTTDSDNFRWDDGTLDPTAVRRIIQDAVARLGHVERFGALRDVQGHVVGSFKVSE